MFTTALESHKIGTLVGSFNKIRKCMSLNFTGELHDMTMKNDTKFEEEWGILKILTWALKNLKILLFSGLLLTKVCNVWTKKAWRSYLSWHWRVVQNLKKKTDLWFGKWYEEFAKFSPEQLKVSKLELWWDPFIKSRKCISLKFTGELHVMKMKNDVKFEK